MAQTARLYKILHVREQEKDQAQMNRMHAVEQFEHVATQLYEQLKEKEAAEQKLSRLMSGQITMEKMKEQSLYIQNLSNQLVSLQRRVQDARKTMENKQALLNDAHIEMKKIEKMIEIRETQKKQAAKRLDATMMDEISMRQFYNIQ